MGNKISTKHKYKSSSVYMVSMNYKLKRVLSHYFFLVMIFSISTIKVFAVGGSTCATAASLNFNGCLAMDALQTFNPAAGLDKTPTCATGTRDFWYTFTPTASTLYFCLYSDFDGALAVYSGNCGSLSQVFCYDAAGTYSTEYKTQGSFTIGNTYFLQILPFSGAGSGTYSVAIGDDQYCWTGWNNAVPTAANNYIGNNAPGASTAVKIPGAPNTAINVTDAWDVGAVTVQSNGKLNIAIPAGISGARTIDIDNLTLASSAQLNISQLHASYGLTLDVLDFSADASSSVNISACNSNFKFKAQDITIKSNASITFPNMGSTKAYTLEARNITVDNNGTLTVQDYTVFSATGDLTINGTMRFDAQLGSNPVIGGNLTINGTLNHQGHRYLYLDGASKTISGTGNFYGGTICPLAIRGSYTFGTLAGNTIRLSHLAILGTGTASIGANTVNTNFFLQDATATFNQNSGVLGIAGPTSLTNPSTGKYSGITWENFGIFTANPTIIDAKFNEGTGTTYFNSGDYTDADIFFVNNQTTPSVTYYNLKIRTNNTKTVTLGTGSNFTASADFSVYNPGVAGGVATTNGTLTVGGNIFIGSLNGSNPLGNALVLNCAHQIYRASGTGTITMGNNPDHAINISYLDAAGAGNECFTGFGTPTFYGTVSYLGNGNQEIIPATFYNITLAGSSGTKTALGNNSVTNTWTNNRAASGFAGSSFKVTFNGNANQNITGSYGTTFNKLEINNSNDVNILKAATVTSSVDFTLGDFVVATSTEPLIFDVSASISTAASDNSHVNGYVAKNTNSVTEFIFPCGDGSLYRLCGVTPSSVSARTYRVKYFSTGLGDYSITGTVIDHVSTLEYWDIAATSGVTKSAQVRLSWGANSGYNANFIDLVNAHYNGTDWEFVPLTYTHSGTAAEGTVLCNENTWSTFSPFTLASTTPRNLPVELINFNANCEQPGIEFNWSTASESNNDFFTIEKSNDLFQWEFIANIPGVGNSNSINSYSYFHSGNINAPAYFRLKQTDFNGEYKYSQIIKLLCDDTESEQTLVYQSNGWLYLSYFSGLEQKSTIKIVNLLGAIVYISENSDTPGYNNIAINTNHLERGVYLIIIQNSNKYSSKKITI